MAKKVKDIYRVIIIACAHLFSDYVHVGTGLGIKNFKRVSPRVCSECGAVEGSDEAKALSKAAIRMKGEKP